MTTDCLDALLQASEVEVVGFRRSVAVHTATVRLRTTNSRGVAEIADKPASYLATRNGTEYCVFSHESFSTPPSEPLSTAIVN